MTIIIKHNKQLGEALRLCPPGNPVGGTVGVWATGAVAMSHLVITYVSEGSVHILNTKSNRFSLWQADWCGVCCGEQGSWAGRQSLRSTSRSTFQPSPMVTTARMRLWIYSKHTKWIYSIGWLGHQKKIRMLPECLPLKGFQARQTGRRPWSRHRTCGGDYVSPLAWVYLGIPQGELGNTGERNIWNILLNLCKKMDGWMEHSKTLTKTDLRDTTKQFSRPSNYGCHSNYSLIK